MFIVGHTPVGLACRWTHDEIYRPHSTSNIRISGRPLLVAEYVWRTRSYCSIQSCVATFRCARLTMIQPGLYLWTKYLYAPPFDPFHQPEQFDTITAVLFLDHACPDSADILMMVSSESVVKLVLAIGTHTNDAIMPGLWLVSHVEFPHLSY
jgi:hypothetical protein